MENVKNVFNFLAWFIFLSFVGMILFGIFGGLISILNTFINWIAEEALQDYHFFGEKYIGLLLIGFLCSAFILKIQNKYKFELVKLTEEERRFTESNSSLNWRNFLF